MGKMSHKKAIILWAVINLILSVQFVYSLGIPDKMPFYTGKIIPTPQQVTYYDEFFNLSKTAIFLGAGVTVDDLRIKILADRITDCGGKITFVDSFSSNYSTVIAFGENILAKPDLPVRCPNREEGYAVYSTKKDNTALVVVEWADSRGLSWAIASLTQLVTYKNNLPVLRKIELYDFPSGDWKRMVFLQPPYNDDSAAAFAVQFKFNTALMHRHPSYAWTAWRQEPTVEWKTDFKKAGEYFAATGIDWYTSIQPVRGCPEEKINSKSDDDFAAVCRIANLIGKFGGNINLMYDDYRFFINPDDKQNFGSAREADIFFLNRFYSELQKKYPSVKILFCPPFYWGPKDDPSNRYGENRDEYLSAVGQKAPQDINILWTGPYVTSTRITKEQMEWYSGKINRKPWIFQNTVGAPHMLGLSYAGDVIHAFKEWYYDGFLQDIAGYVVPCEVVTQVILSDYLWNPQAYDPEESVKEAIGTLLGQETYQSLLALNKKLSELDKYGTRVSPAAIRDVSIIKKTLAEAELIWQECLRFHPESVRRWSGMDNIIKMQKSFISRIEKNPDLTTFADAAEKVRETAIKESNLDINNDVFISPYDFLGGGGPKEYSYKCEKRLATWIYGAQTNMSCMKTTFRLDGVPTSDYRLIISGQDDDREKKCRIKITVNGNRIFEGDNPFVRFGWSMYAFPVKGEFLKDSDNILSICNMEKNSNTAGPPFFMFNYAILKSGVPDSPLPPVTEKVAPSCSSTDKEIPSGEVNKSVETQDDVISPVIFRPSLTLDNVPIIYYLDVADLNGDGISDLIASCHIEKKVNIYYQKDGKFSSAADKELIIDKPRGVIAGDFNKDSRNDLAVVWGKNLSLYLGSENFQTAYESHSINQYDFKPAYGKLSEDGADFMVGPVWRKWLGKNSFQDKGYVYGPPEELWNSEVILADINSDGINDMVFSARNNATIRIYLGPFFNMRIRPADTLQFIQFKNPSFDRIEDFIVADLNSDGRLDIAAVARNENERSLLIYYQGIPGGFVDEMVPSTVKKIGSLQTKLAFGDINNDGLIDIVINNHAFFQKENQRLFENSDSPNITLCDSKGRDLTDTVTRRGILLVKVVDINNDGRSDIVISRQLTSNKGQVLIFLNNFPD